MHRVLKFALLVGATTNAVAHAGTRTLERLPEAREIVSVWDLSMQPCNGGGGNAFTRNPAEARIKLEKHFDFSELGYRFNVPQLPNVDETVIKIRLNDRERGVTEHYILLADHDLEPPFAAVVITEMPEGIKTREGAFDAVVSVQRGLAGSVTSSLPLREIDGPYGKALELLVPNRVGTHCFPTSKFALLPPDKDVETMGISRFVFDNNRLIEFALIVRMKPKMSTGEREAFARLVMDGFWRSLAPI